MKRGAKKGVVVLSILLLLVLLAACSNNTLKEVEEDNFLEIKVGLSHFQSQSLNTQLKTLKVELKSASGIEKEESRSIENGVHDLSFRFSELKAESWDIYVLAKDEWSNIIYSGKESVELNFGGLTEIIVDLELETVTLEVLLDKSEGIEIMAGKIELIKADGDNESLDLTNAQQLKFKDLKPYSVYLKLDLETSDWNKEKGKLIDIWPGIENTVNINIDSGGVLIW